MKIKAEELIKIANLKLTPLEEVDLFLPDESFIYYEITNIEEIFSIKKDYPIYAYGDEEGIFGIIFRNGCCGLGCYIELTEDSTIIG